MIQILNIYKMNNERELRLLNICKQMFKLWTNETIETAKAIIEIEQEILATQSDKPKAEDEKINVQDKSVKAPVNVKTISNGKVSEQPHVSTFNDDSNDLLPF